MKEAWSATATPSSLQLRARSKSRANRFPLHLRRRKVGVDDNCIIGKETHHRLQILGLNRGEDTYDEIM